MPGSASVTASTRCYGLSLAEVVGAAGPGVGAWSNLAGPHGSGPPLALVTRLSGGVQEFGHCSPGTAVAGVGFAAEPAPQFHLDLDAMALGNPVEEGVLVADRQVLDPSGQL